MLFLALLSLTAPSPLQPAALEHAKAPAVAAAQPNVQAPQVAAKDAIHSVHSVQSVQSSNGCQCLNGNQMSGDCAGCSGCDGSGVFQCSSGGSSSCFAKDSTTVCLLSSPLANCEHTLMADLVPGNLVLGRDGATTVIANQHKAVDTLAEMLTLHTADSEVSMTSDHAVFVDGELVKAADAKVGSSLSTGVITHITKREAAIINAVTADGTIVADGVLAASNPYWIASLTVDAPLTRAVVNAAIYAAGDVDTYFAGCAKVATTLVVAALAAKALRSRKASA